MSKCPKVVCYINLILFILMLEDAMKQNLLMLLLLLNSIKFCRTEMMLVPLKRTSPIIISNLFIYFRLIKIIMVRLKK